MPLLAILNCSAVTLVCDRQFYIQRRDAKGMGFRIKIADGSEDPINVEVYEI